jgi:N-dimethylarginine dimethylaminohydrolase
MCPPQHFTVAYRINPWMDPTRPVDTHLAVRQWERLRAAYEAHGHTVHTISPVAGLPDMVYSANSALVLDGKALLSHFRYPQRRGEEAPYERWFHDQGLMVVRAREIHEGEGDFAVAGDTILAATGFRTTPAAHAEAASTFDRPVLSLRLVDPRFYHLDTALCVLSPEQIMYYPAAFDKNSVDELRKRYPDALVADESEALAFGLNATSDGSNVFLAAQAETLAARLDQAGYKPVPVDLSELVRGGGNVKCCTLELR